MDGIFNGTIRSEGTLIVGKDARVTGQIRVGQLILGGRLEGEIEASKRAALHSTAVLVGNLYAPLLVVEEGGVIEGSISMREDVKPSQQLIPQADEYEDLDNNS